MTKPCSPSAGGRWGREESRLREEEDEGRRWRWRAVGGEDAETSLLPCALLALLVCPSEVLYRMSHLRQRALECRCAFYIELHWCYRRTAQIPTAGLGCAFPRACLQQEAGSRCSR